MKNALLKFLFFGVISVPMISKADIDTLKIIKEPTITESRSPSDFNKSLRDIAIITSDDIKKMPVSSIQDVLMQTAGVDISQRGGQGVQGDVSIRGGGFDQTLILINGVRFTDAMTGHFNLNIPVSLADIDRIEILRGAASRIYGQSGLSGAINIILKPLDSNTINFDMALGKFGYNRQMASLTAVTNKVSQSFSMSRVASTGYRSNTDFANTQGLYQLHLKTKFIQSEVMAGALTKDFGANGFYSLKYPTQYEETKTYFANVKLSSDVVKGLSLNLSYRGNNDLYMLKRENPAFYQNIHFSENFQGGINYINNNKLGRSFVGASGQISQILSTNLGSRKRFIYDVFAEHKFTFWDKLFITPGININIISEGKLKQNPTQVLSENNNKPQFFPSIDAGFKIKNYLFFASYSKSYRMPTYIDLYYKDPTSAGNSTLLPEACKSFEGGIKYFGGFFFITGTVFNRQISNQIDFVLDDNKTSYTAKNLRALTMRGADISLRIDISQLTKSQILKTLNLSYCYVESNTKTDGNTYRYALNYLRNQFTGSIEINYLPWLSQQIQFRSAYRLSTKKEFNVLDTKLDAHIKKSFHVFGEVSNLFQAKYEDFAGIPMPGAWYRFGISFNGKW